MGVPDRANRSPGFLTWMHKKENRDEVIALGYIAKECYRSPSYYAFRDVKIPVLSEYEIDTYVTAMRKEHEAELAREAEQRAASSL